MNKEDKKRLIVIRHSMYCRCYYPTTHGYERYGGRGIKICEEWINNPDSFYDWAINNGYKKGLTLDRIDVNGNYEPSNCRWVTKKEQSQNRRCVYKLFYKGKEMFLDDISKETGIKHNTILNRYHKYGLCDKVFSIKSLKTGEVL